MRKILIWLFCILSTVLQAQNTITGTILNHQDKKPIEFASVYINGTAKGVYTDAEGNFELNNVPVPCQIIISHIQFEVMQIKVESISSKKTIIYLNEKSSEISNIDVVVKSKRKEVIKNFKDVFLGDDKWGKNAVLKNEDVLYFSRRIDTVKIDNFSKNPYYLSNSTKLINENKSVILSEFQVLSAKSKSSIFIELPLLGYSVFVDLVSFDIRTSGNWAECNYWAYYRFEPYTLVTKPQQAHYEKTRQTVYYNSSKHFCKSLFDNKLKENGYLLSFTHKKDSTNYIDLSNYIQRVDSTEIKIIGLKNQEIHIDYFEKKNNPIDLTINSYNPLDKKNVCKYRDLDQTSSVIFKSDTCTIRSNGTIPDTNILFDGEIASKRGGALLPNEYIPPKVIVEKNKKRR